MMKLKLFKKVWVPLLLAVFVLSATPITASQTKEAEETERISAEEVRRKVQSGEALLVCAYDDDKCKEILLEGAVLRSEFESRLPSLAKNQEVIFYCQ